MRYGNGFQETLFTALVYGLVIGAAGALSGGCGQAIPLSTEGFLGDAVVTGTGGTRTDGSDLGNIYNVTTVVAATQGNPFATTAELPFSGPVRAFGNTAPDAQWPMYFTYTYPSNNYKLAEAHLVMDVTRDTSETEGIFVDGVFSGRGASMNTSSTQVTHHIYNGNTAGQSLNQYFSTFPMTHYRHSTRNSFDLLIDNLITSTPVLNVKTVDLINDGQLNVVTGDDAAVYAASLVMKGVTISKEPLSCVNSSNFSFTNVYMHDDGNTISQAAFSGTVVSPYGSTQAAAAGFRSTEWNYDAKLPQVTATNITLTSATIGSAQNAASAFIVRKNTAISPKAAIVINGVGVAETGFDKNQATAVVESWESGAAVTYFENWVASIPDTGADTTATLDLIAMLGAAKVRSLLAQGKLNVALAGSIVYVYSNNNTTARAITPAVVTVAGPDLAIAGTYYTELCTIPDDPTSPLSDDEEIPSGVGDTTSPLTYSIQATEITSSSATIQWLTNESATSQVGYGVGNTDTLTTATTDRVTFHSVKLTGLQPYKVYKYNVRSSDYNGNATISGAKSFTTLR